MALSFDSELARRRAQARTCVAEFLDLPENAEMPSTGTFFVIQRSVFEDSGRQIVLISPTFVVVGNVHAVVIWFVICFSSFRRSRLQKLSNFLREPLRAAAISGQGYRRRWLLGYRVREILPTKQLWSLRHGGRRLACSDWYRPDYFKQLADAGGVARNPHGPETPFDPAGPSEKKRVHKGGSFLCTDQYCTRYMMGTRGKGEVNTGTNHLGFRCVQAS